MSVLVPNPHTDARDCLRLVVSGVRSRFSREDSIIEALSAAVEAKDPSASGHASRVTTLARRIAGAIDPRLERNRNLTYGFTLHDVGKIGVPEEILFKTSSLDSAEWEVMRTHPAVGSRIISPAQLGREAEEVVLHHHERWDGDGYPNRLKGDQIPIGARLFAVADAYDAMTNDRPYRGALPSEVAIDELASESGRQFDPQAVDAFLRVVLVGERQAPEVV